MRISSVHRTVYRMEPMIAPSPTTMAASRVKNRFGSGGSA